MATIPSTTNQLRHVRKTITFTGGAGAGAVGTVTVFTITGRTLLERFTCFCTNGLTAAAPSASLQVGVAGGSNKIVDLIPDAENIDTDEWVSGSGSISASINDESIWPRWFGSRTLSTNIIVTIGSQNITGGVLVFDCWYLPITDDGALAGDDIDAGYTPVDVKAWLGTAAATPTVAGVPEVDVTHNAGTAITAAAGVQEVKVASVAAAAITAAAIATGAIDADALAADAVDEIWAKAMSDLAAVPGATDSVLAAINWLFELARNKREQTATTETIYKDDGATALAISAKTDAGATFTLGEYT